MTGNIVGEPIVEAIDKQIDYRQQIHGAGYIPGTQNLQRTPEVQNYLNNRNSWIKMASGISLSGSAAVDKITALSNDSSNYLREEDIEAMQGEGLAKNLVLFNSTQKLDSTKNSYIKRSGAINSYNFLDNSNKMYGGLGSSQRGLQPVPGIIDMSVECLNRGSIRKATIKLKAYNKFQFGLIELLYLRLGYSVMLEWGWDKYIDKITPSDNAITPPTVMIEEMGSTIIENQWFDGNSYSQTDMINLVLANEEIFKGNYGGFFGKVSNFSWTLNTDNTYDITLNLITVGSVIESLNIKIPAINLDSEAIKSRRIELKNILKLDINDSEISDSDNVILANVGSDKLSQWVNYTLENFNDLRTRYIKTHDYVLGGDLAGVDIQGKASYITVWKNNIPTESRFFVRFETFLSFIQDFLVSNIKNEGKEDKELIFELDPELSRCNYETNLVPLNANKVIFSVLMGEEVLSNINAVKTQTGSNKGRPIAYMNANMAEFATKKDGVIYGKLLNCYLNLTFIQQAFVDSQNNKEEVSLFGFLQTICDGINESTGNCTDLEVILKKDKTVVIIDQNQIKGGDKLIKKYEEKTSINIYGYEPQGSSTFVKDFKFQTKITPDLMNMVTIGATASDEKDVNAIPFQTWNKGLVNRFGQSQYYNSDEDLLTDLEKDDISNEEFKKAFSKAIIANDGNSNYSSGGFFLQDPKGYRFTYNGIKIIGIWVSGVDSIDSNRTEDSKNQALLSEGLRMYKIERNKKSKILDSTDVLKDSKEANNNYMVYLSRAFGGDSGYKSFITTEAGTNTAASVSKISYSTKNISTRRIVAQYFSWDNDNFIQQGKNAFKKYLSNINKAEAIASTPVISGTGFIPLELDITMDGLSGIKIYNRLKINTKFLPSSYPKALKFIVKGVNHKVSGNVWDTNISTISVPVSKDPPIKSTNTTSTIQTTSTTNTTIVKGNPLLKEVLKNAEYNPGTASYELALAIGTKEGWNPNDNGGVGSRSYRNNNPGNLDFGTLAQTIDPGAAKEDNQYGTNRFAVFSTAELGAKALVETKIKRWSKGKMPITSGNQSLLANVTGKTYKKGSPPSFREFLYTYAPPNENNTEGYLNTVVNNLNNAFPSANITADSIIESIIEIYG